MTVDDHPSSPDNKDEPEAGVLGHWNWLSPSIYGLSDTLLGGQNAEHVPWI